MTLLDPRSPGAAGPGAGSARVHLALLDRAPVAPEASRPAADPVTGVLDVLGLDRLAPVSLRDVLEAAALQTRVDRKYLVPIGTAAALVRALRPSHHVLRIAGRLGTSYGSTYFDTDDRTAFRAHAQGRRRRWKVRTRVYREDLLCRLEVKTDVAGTTVKYAQDVPAGMHGRLDDAGRRFVADRFAHHELPGDPAHLVPTASVDYVRATLCDLARGTRLTIDGGLLGSLGGRAVRLRDDHVLVETKGGVRASDADRVLLAHGVRPLSVSKYSVSMSLLEPHLPGTRWRRVARDYFLLDG